MKRSTPPRSVSALGSAPFRSLMITQLTANSAFTTDLGLDSLDAVEVVMAIEEEFAVEIPDAEADEITTVQQG